MISSPALTQMILKKQHFFLLVEKLITLPKCQTSKKYLAVSNLVSNVSNTVSGHGSLTIDLIAETAPRFIHMRTFLSVADLVRKHWSFLFKHFYFCHFPEQVAAIY